jgi:hypothetical protein
MIPESLFYQKRKKDRLEMAFLSLVWERDKASKQQIVMCIF